MIFTGQVMLKVFPKCWCSSCIKETHTLTVDIIWRDAGRQRRIQSQRGRRVWCDGGRKYDPAWVRGLRWGWETEEHRMWQEVIDSVEMSVGELKDEKNTRKGSNLWGFSVVSPLKASLCYSWQASVEIWGRTQLLSKIPTTLRFGCVFKCFCLRVIAHVFAAAMLWQVCVYHH